MDGIFILSTILLIVSAIFFFLRDLLNVEKENRHKFSYYIFPVLIFSVAILAIGVNFVEAKRNNDQKNTSDSLANVYRIKNDSLINRQMYLLGGKDSKPQFAFLHNSPDQFTFWLVDTSEFTLRDFSVTITDIIASNKFYDNLDKQFKDTVAKKNYITSMLLNNQLPFQKVVPINYLTPNTWFNLSTITIDSKADKIHYIVNLYYTGGNQTYYIYYTKRSDGWNKDSIKLYDRLTQITTFQ